MSKLKMRKNSHAGAQGQKDEPLEQISVTDWNVLRDKIWNHKA